MELWSVTDNQEDQRLKFRCQTLYNLRLKKYSDEPVTREIDLPYAKVWNYFGLNKRDLTRTQLHLIASLYLKTLFLFLPTMEFNKGDEEDSENEERAMISSRPIDCVAFARRIIKVGDKKVPVTV